MENTNPHYIPYKSPINHNYYGNNLLMNDDFKEEFLLEVPNVNGGGRSRQIKEHLLKRNGDASKKKCC